MGEMITTSYNLKNELVGPRAASGPTTTGAHFSNTDADGNFAMHATPTFADWLMQSLCSSHIEEKHQWGPGIGLEDRLYITNEEWMYYLPGVKKVVGLAAHAVDTATYTDYALGVMTQGGFEKIVEFSTGSTEYVAFSISGYNGAFSGLNKTDIVAARNRMGLRDDGQPYVWPQNIVPARFYLGKKGFDEAGTTATDFLSKNGLRYGQVYGFACDVTTECTDVRDTWHKNHYKGDTVNGAFYKLDWKWEGPATGVKNFEYDGSWDFQDYPRDAPANTEFWTSLGPNAGGKKTEHNSPAFRSDTDYAFTQTSTAGYFGDYIMANMATEIAAVNAGAGASNGNHDADFPVSISAQYYLWQGETDITGLIDLGGKGLRADGQYQYKNCDKFSGGVCTSEHSTFEDIDGFEVVTSAEGRFAIILEDSGNDFGERSFIVKLDENNPLSYKWIAQSGGPYNTRMLNYVGVPKGVNTGAGSHEFSGTIDISGMLASTVPSGGGITYQYTAADDGHVKHTAEAAMSINDKYFVIGLQGHNMAGGVIYYTAGDRGGQWLLYKPSGL
jgi:hypothetical protein